MSGETILYLLHILQSEMVDMGNKIINYTSKFIESTELIQVDKETNTLTLNKLIIQNLNDEQLLIKSEDKSVLCYLSNVTFHNPINIHDILTVTSIVCDDLKDSTNKKYLTENDIDVDIIKEIIKVLNDNKIQITCSQLHCDLITNTAFEPYALEKNHYTKTEADEKFALKNELSAPDLSNYYMKEECDELFLKSNDLGNELRSEYISFFQQEVRICGFRIYFDTSTPNTIKMRSNIEIIGENNNETVKFTNCKPIDTDGYSYITEQSLNNYYTKNDCDTKYVAKNDPIELSATYNDTYPITISGDQLYACDYIKFVADKDYDNIQYTIDYDNIQYTINYQKGTNQGLIFRCNGSDLMRLNNDDKSTIVNNIKNMDGIEYVLKSELDEYVITETLEDVITQINNKFDAIEGQKKRWKFKVTMPANSQSVKIDMNEDITKYNVALSNSDGSHVFVYQEIDNNLEIIVLEVILTSTYLIVEASKICKNSYNVYLCFDEYE